MPITFRHDAAAVMPPSNATTRKYGQQLVAQQQQQKYQAQQAGYDRLFQLGRDVQQNQFQFARDVRQNVAMQRRDQAQNAFVLERDKAQAEQQMQKMQAEQQRRFMDDARKQSSGMIMEDIQNQEYDPATARKLQQNLVAESEALGNPNLDATQRAEALAKIRAERALLTANRLQKPPPPTPQEQFDKGVVTDPSTGMRYRQNSKGDYEPLPQQQQRPSTADEAFAADPKLRDKYMADAIEIETKTLVDGEIVQKPLDRDSRKKAAALARQLWEEDNLPNAAPGLPAGAAPASPGASQSILEAPTAALPAPGSPPSPARTPTEAQRPDPGMPPSPQYPAAPAAQAPVPSAPQQVQVGGRPLVVTPGTLTPQETAARAQLMEMPREQRIAALMPYDPELKGKTLEQILESPESKAKYDELSKQGLTTGNYREDMLAHIDEMVQRNVLNTASTPPPAYVGMRADDITDPKAKAEVAKMPRPKTPEDMRAIRGPYFIDPDGIIRSTKKQA